MALFRLAGNLVEALQICVSNCASISTGWITDVTSALIALSRIRISPRQYGVTILQALEAVSETPTTTAWELGGRVLLAQKGC